jgi:transposase
VIFVGLDIGRESHRYCVLDANKTVLDKGVLPNASWAFDGWARHIEDRDGDVVVGLETQSGLSSPLDQYLEQRGWQLRQVTPEAVKAYRETVLRLHNKTDETDAFTIARVLLDRSQSSAGPTDLPKYPRRQLRAATRWREGLVRSHTRLCNTLRRLTAQYWPELTQQGSPFYRMDLKYVQLLFERCPDPSVIASRGVDSLTRFFREHKSTVSLATIEAIVQLARQNEVTLEEKPILLRQTQVVARTLRQLCEDIADAERTIEKLVKTDAQVQQLSVIRGVSVTQAAAFMAEVQDINNFRSEAHLASYSGHGLRRVQTGKSKDSSAVQWRSNRHLKRCMYLIADGMRANDLRSRRHYDKKIADGKSHRQALRCVGRQVIRMFFAMLKRGRVYDEKQAITLRTKSKDLAPSA